jgi:diaminopimelate decarboxylase
MEPYHPMDVQTVAMALERVQSRGLLSLEDTAVIFYDLGLLRKQLARIRRAFPPSALHASAVKANPLPAIMRRLRQWDAGAEVASWPELLLAEAAGFPPERIVFDSPAKTAEEIRYALGIGAGINADNLDEVQRIAELRRASPESRSAIGIRVNPQIGTGRIAATSTAGIYSKFGVPFNERREELLQAFAQHPWLRGIHVHVGSQGCSLEMLVAGVRRTVEFAREVDQRLGERKRRIETVDIGGGLPVAYRAGDTEIDIETYAATLARECPALFDGTYRVITEFGRYLHAHAGWVASKVEYVKTVANIPTAVLHVGADLLGRECQNPELWPHTITVHEPSGAPRGGDEQRWNLAGPLCFSGDMPATGVPLPEIRPGDFVVFHDIGAYTLSMWSRYNSRQTPKVLGYDRETGEFEILKDREKPGAILAYWS